MSHSLKSHAAIVLIHLALLAPAMALTPPPTPPLRAADKVATLRIPQLNASMGRLKVTFEQTTLSEIANAAGTGTIAHRGDAGESLYWVCFTVQKLRRSEKLWITASGEMGGPEHRITGMSSTFVITRAATADCPLLPRKLTPVALDDGLWLGTYTRDLPQLLGGSLLPNHSWGTWQYQGKIPSDHCAGGLDRITTLKLHSNSGRVTTLYADQVTTC